MLKNIPTVGQLCQLADLLTKQVVASFRTNLNIETKADASLVTSVDKQANATAQEWAKKFDIGFVGEEGSDAKVHQNYALYIDPLDGTSTYAAGKAEVSIVITLMRCIGGSWVPEICVIAEPMTGWIYFATKNGGVFQQGPNDAKPRPMEKISHHESPFNVSVVTWRNVPFRLDRVQNVVKTHHLMHHRSSGNTGINGPLIASGYMHGLVYAGRCATESAAISLMVKQAGGTVLDLTGQSISSFELEEVDGKLDFTLPRGLIAASSPEVAALLVDIVRRAQ